MTTRGNSQRLNLVRSAENSAPDTIDAMRVRWWEKLGAFLLFAAVMILAITLGRDVLMEQGTAI